MNNNKAFPDSILLLLKQVESSVPSSSHLAIEDVGSSGFSIQVGRSSEAVVTVTICDPEIPSFAATYPSLRSGWSGSGESIEERTTTNMLAEGVVWIVRKVFRFGFVPPEGYRKKQSNRGKPNQPPQRTPAATRPPSLS